MDNPGPYRKVSESFGDSRFSLGVSVPVCNYLAMDSLSKKKLSSGGWALGVLGLVTATVATWWFSLGWDTEYQKDPVTGVVSGPYEVPQVVGCVLALVLVTAVGGVLLRPWVTAVVVTLSFTVAWSYNAASTDETGLWGVGAIMVLVGMSVGTTLVAALAWWIAAHRAVRALGAERR